MAENTPVKAEKPKKKGPSLGERLNRWFRETRSEMKKVVWSPWKQVKTNTWVVIVSIVIVSAFIGLFDAGLAALIGLIIK
ncbi:MAG: preprotein translocase subunit SecE [Bacillota bacterium]|nr:preprotein translocase subunit SecE [Bacillota bacterium]